jgi:hypothetical protein
MPDVLNVVLLSEDLVIASGLQIAEQWNSKRSQEDKEPRPALGHGPEEHEE